MFSKTEISYELRNETKMLENFARVLPVVLKYTVYTNDSQRPTSL